MRGNELLCRCNIIVHCRVQKFSLSSQTLFVDVFVFSAVPRDYSLLEPEGDFLGCTVCGVATVDNVSADVDREVSSDRSRE